MHHSGPADRAMVVVDWPTTDLYTDPRDALVAAVLADVMRSRLFDQLRIAHGQTYSPSAYAQFSPNLPGYGLIGVAVSVQPQAVDQTFVEIDAIAADLAAHPVTDDELLRALAPRIETAKRDRLGNGYWMNLLGGVQREPRVLDYARDTVPMLQTIAPADVLASAKKWLVRTRSWRAQVTPQAP
jgi:zinc protease